MALEGTLQDMPLADLFKVFSLNTRSGRLILTHNNDQGVVTWSRGHIVDAVILNGVQRSPIAVDKEALLQLFTWDDALFTFEHDPALAHQPLRIFIDYQQLLMEVAQRRNTAVQKALTFHDVIGMSKIPPESLEIINLTRNEWQFLAACGRESTITDISQRASLTSSDALAIARSLELRGLIYRSENTPACIVPAITRKAQVTSSIPVNNVSANQPNGALLKAIIRRVRSL